MSYQNKPVLISFILVFCLSFFPLAQAENISSEIINIDLGKKIVFVDLGRDVLSVGDIMNVEGIDHPIYLEVTDTSEAVSKLKISGNKKYYSNISEFDNLAIGLQVTLIFAVPDSGHSVPPAAMPVISENAPAIDSTAFVKPDLSKESVQSMIDHMDIMADANVKLAKDLAQCQEERDKYKKQAEDLLAKFNVLKVRLDHLDSGIGEH